MNIRSIPILLVFSIFSYTSYCQDTLSFKINNGGTSSKNSIGIVYSIGDLLVSHSPTSLSVFPITSLPEFVITGLKESTYGDIQISIFPNPVVQLLSVQSSEERGTLILFDSLGKVIKEGSWPTELSFEGYQPGEYYLVLTSIKQTVSYKVIKQ
ncbi:MAG: T9SS type A sorting domain-containing protein [Cyclobacteriaceae bacterium]|nr:T9SS type A sorting domain-containing protein [Cyclobacteriaceae bacterium]